MLRQPHFVCATTPYIENPEDWNSTSEPIQKWAPVLWTTSSWAFGLSIHRVFSEQDDLVGGSSSLKLLQCMAENLGYFHPNRLLCMSFPVEAAASYCKDNNRFWLTRKSCSYASSGAWCITVGSPPPFCMCKDAEMLLSCLIQTNLLLLCPETHKHVCFHSSSALHLFIQSKNPEGRSGWGKTTAKGSCMVISCLTA